MEIYNVDVPEMEKQRYDLIKNSGKYLEINILIGVENEDMGDGLVSKAPVISTHMCKCGSQEVGCLYVTLGELMKSLEKKYPMECYIAKLSMRVDNLGAIDNSDEEE